MAQSRVVVGMSGGVDSSVTALLLLEQGFEVHGVFMKNWEDSFNTGYCTAADDIVDAEDVCETLGIPLHKVNFATEYRERVFAHFLAEYRSGRTPNPDILCNKEIKFRAFLDHARSLGADYLATGHYARVSFNDGPVLRKGVDNKKDQSYFLHALSAEQLSSSIFPLGEMEKSAVRNKAKHAGLINYDKKDSTGICFIGPQDFRRFLGAYLEPDPGPMLTPAGEWLGEHQGLMFYTIGQRQGLGLGGKAGASGAPWYVVDKDIEHNVLVVAQGEHELLFKRRLMGNSLHWISGAPPATAFACMAKTRYRQPDQACRVCLLNDAQCEVVFEQAQRAVTPGQSVVFYRADRCLGGAVIERAYN